MRVVPVAVLTAALMLGCSADVDGTVSSADDEPSTATSTPSPSSLPSASTSPEPSMEPATAEPSVRRVGDARWERIVQAGVWRPECPVGREDLRVLRVNHVDLDGDIRRGTLIAHRDVVPSLSRIMEALFEQGFPINRMEPVEAYDGDLRASLEANNTVAFHCRRPDQINAPVLESPHANGRAIDINPDLNPWVDVRTRQWSPRARHAERTPGPGKILPDGPVVRLFEDEGWVWQNIDVPDYMHFDTGYPSVPWSSPND